MNDAERRRAAVLRRMREHGGIWVECMGCGLSAKHLPSKERRLRTKQCPACGARMRSRAWVLKYPGRAHEERKRWGASRRAEEQRGGGGMVHLRDLLR